MAIRIQRLICNVTVHTSPSSSAETGPVMTSRELPTLPTTSPPTALQRTLEAGDGAAAPQSSSVDPRKLADKVYRLMLDDLRIARERE